MCVVSNIGDQYADYFPKRHPNVNITPGYVSLPEGVSREEFDQLRKEVEALKELLKAAKIYDEVTGQPDCEMDDKVELIRRIADLVGVDLEDVFG